MADNILKRIEELMATGDFAAAESLASTITSPQDTRLSVFASIAMRAGDSQKAEVLFEKVLAVNPDHPIAIGNLGQLLAGQGKFKRALDLCERAHRAAPRHEVYALNYAACLVDADRFRDAGEVLRPYAEAEKPSARVLIAISSVLRADLRADEALQVLERARDLYPEDQDCQRAIADAYAEIDARAARTAFKKAEKTAKNPIALRWNWSFVELRLQNFKKGWELYENGLSEKVGKVGRPLPGVVRMFERITDFEKLDAEKYTLWSCEQGIGDQILFLGCFDKVLERFPRSILVAEDRMVPLLQRAFPSIQVGTYGFAYSLSGQQERLNGIFPIGSFQKYFRSSVAVFKKTRHEYLSPNEKLVAKYRRMLESTQPGAKLVGIAWTGGHWDRQKRTKSFDFELFSKLMKRPGYRFVALQYGDVTKERALAKENGWPVTFVSGVDFKKDLDAWHALACACDRVISVSTALVHFAGASGKRVDVLMPDRQGPFIWGLEDGRSVAYPDVHTWRKIKGEESEAFFERIAEQLL